MTREGPVRGDTEKALELALTAGQNRPERLPGLLTVFGQLPRIMAEELGAVLPVPFKLRLLDVAASTYGEACVVPRNGLAGIARAERWRNWVFLLSDPSLTTFFIDAAAGCEPMLLNGWQPRQPTRTDCNIARVVFRRVARSLASAFSVLTDISFEVGFAGEKIETEPPMSGSAAVFVGRLAFDFAGQAGVLKIVIPQAALDPIRNVLSAPPATAVARGARTREDPVWSRQLADEIARAFITLDGVLEERPIPLGDVQRFAAGSVIELDSTELSRVRLDADDNPLFWCELGKREGALIMRVEREFDRDTEGIDEYFGL